MSERLGGLLRIYAEPLERHSTFNTLHLARPLLPETFGIKIKIYFTVGDGDKILKNSGNVFVETFGD